MATWSLRPAAAMVLAATMTMQTAAADEPADLRVMSFNLRYGTAKDGENAWDKRKEFLVRTVAAFGPDLLGTQETLVFQRDYLLKELPGYETYGVGRDDGRNQGETASVLWRKERFEKLAEGSFWLSATPDVVGSKGWDAALPRVASWVRLRDRKKTEGKPLLFVNVHFDHKGAAARTGAGKLLRERLPTLGAGCDLILTGDFNCGEGSEPYRAVFGKQGDETSPLVDTLRVAVPERGPEEGTFNGFDPTATRGDRIDWIGCSPTLPVRSAAIDRTVRDGRTPSDHFPVTAVLGR